MSEPESKTCATCRWWEEDYDATGTCALTIFDGETDAAQYPETRAIALADSDVAQSWLMTNADFGCNQWQGKE